LAAQLVSGTLVTAAGPHAGDKSIEGPGSAAADRNRHLVQLHAALLIAYLALLLGLGFRVRRVRADRQIIRRLVYC
jgi:cytochrome c oxidase assembly protein subunit 15